MDNKLKFASSILVATFLTTACGDRDSNISFDYPDGMENKARNGDEITTAEISQTKDNMIEAACDSLAGKAFSGNKKSNAIKKLQKEYSDDCVDQMWDALRP